MFPRAMLLALAAAVGITIGCNSERECNPTPNTAPAPVVLGTTPRDGATDVHLYQVIEIRFSEPMGPSVTDTSNFHIDGVAIRAIFYEAGSHTAAVYPASIVDPLTEQKIRVNGDVKSEEGIAMGREFVFSFTTGPLDYRHLRDRFEPNDEPETATLITTDGLYPGLSICGSADEDFYRFKLTETRMVRVTCEMAYCPSPGAGWEIDFLDQETDFCGQDHSSPSPGYSAFSTHHTLLPGEYFLRVMPYPFWAQTPYVIYHLKMEDLDPVPDDAYEDNDYFDDPTPITAGSYEGLRGTYLDYDYYSIYVEADRTLTVTMTEVSNTGARRVLGIEDPIRAYGTWHINQLNPTTEVWRTAISGNYSVYVLWLADSVIYNLDIDVAE